MSRYGELVRHSLISHFPDHLEVSFCQLGMSVKKQLLFPGPLRGVLNHAHIAWRARSLNRLNAIDVIHVLDGSFGHFISGISAYPVVATVHDIIPKLQASGFFAVRPPGIMARWLIEKSLAGIRNCKCLISDSLNTRKDLIVFVGILAEKVRVVNCALEPTFTAAAEEQKRARGSAESGNASPPIILHVGNNAFYKNRSAVLRIFQQIIASVPARLIMAGPPPTREMLDFVDAANLTASVEFIVNPIDSVLQNLYRNASVFLFPSVYEGFGWPPLEAMASGCPVVCSSAASLPEVVGDAALQSSFDDVSGFAEHCVRIITDENLAADLTNKGYDRVAGFTAQRMANELYAVYQGVVSEKSTRAKQHGA